MELFELPPNNKGCGEWAIHEAVMTWGVGTRQAGGE